MAPRLLLPTMVTALMSPQRLRPPRLTLLRPFPPPSLRLGLGSLSLLILLSMRLSFMFGLGLFRPPLLLGGAPAYLQFLGFLLLAFDLVVLLLTTLLLSVPLFAEQKQWLHVVFLGFGALPARCWSREFLCFFLWGRGAVDELTNEPTDDENGQPAPEDDQDDDVAWYGERMMHDCHGG